MAADAAIDISSWRVSPPAAASTNVVAEDQGTMRAAADDCASCHCLRAYSIERRAAAAWRLMRFIAAISAHATTFLFHARCAFFPMLFILKFLRSAAISMLLRVIVFHAPTYA